MLFAQYMCCSPSMEVQIEETGNRKQWCWVYTVYISPIQQAQNLPGEMLLDY